MKLVSKKTPAKAINTIPRTPGIMLAKNKPAITAAIMILIIRSAFPIFFFISSFFCLTQ